MLVILTSDRFGNGGAGGTEDAGLENQRGNRDGVVRYYRITDPLATIPIFITLTSGQSAEERKRTANTTAITVATVLVLSVFVGEPLLRVFGVSVASFRVGGGIVILLMAISMLNA